MHIHIMLSHTNSKRKNSEQNLERKKKRTDYFKSKNTFRASRNFEYLVCLDGCDTRSMYVVFRLKSKRKIEFSCKRITEIEIYDNFTGWFSLRHFIRFSYSRK